MPSLIDLIIEGQAVQNHRPWPRAVVQTDIWRFAIDQLVERRWILLGLWGDGAMAHMALLDEQRRETGIISLECAERRFPSVGALHTPASRLERAMRDLHGLEAEGALDRRPWLDHGRWAIGHPQAAQPTPASPSPAYAFLPAEGEGLHQIAVGPVHAGIIEPGHFRFTVNGEAVVRLEERLGYVHKGVEGLMRGVDLRHGCRLAGRLSGDSTVAYSFAFARAAEAALGVEIPPRAQFLRALMAELERLANHFGDIGAICNDASFAIMHTHCGILRERTLRASYACFGHRLMRDGVVPGGVAADLSAESAALLHQTIAELGARFPALVELYDNTASLQQRMVATGILSEDLARRFGCGGFVGRASGRNFDARRTLPYPPYDRLDFEVPTLGHGDVNARVWIRIREIEQSLALVGQILDRLPGGDIAANVEAIDGGGEGVAMVEGFRGDILVWLRLDADGKIARCHLRDPSWFQWPLLEAVVEGNIVADFPLCNKSFNCSYSGHDL